MGVKRWLALLAFGVIWVIAGAAVLLNAPVFSILERHLLTLIQSWDWDSWLFGLFLILFGLLWISVAIRYGIRSLIAAIQPEEVSSLAEHVYKSRSLQKGPSIVAVGGGTGLATMLRGLKEYSSNITAIVTVADDGGSSGRIREEMGILPPGDIRNTIIALADTEPLMEKLFQYRFSWGSDLEGHSFGNLFIAAMTDITGDFEESVRKFSKVLAVRGKVLPSTLETVKLGANFTDGSRLLGESQIPLAGKKIASVFLDPPRARALPEALEAIAQADLVVLGPGSLYTSVIPNLLVEPIVDALLRTSALRVYVCNVMTQPGETEGLSAGDHISALLAHAGNQPILDYALVNQTRISGAQAQKYAQQGSYPVLVDWQVLRYLDLKIRCGDFLDKSDLVRHDSTRLAREIMSLIGVYSKDRSGP